MQSIEQQRLLHNREHLCNIYTTTIGPRSPSYFAYRRDAIDRTTEARLDPENMLNKMKYSDTSLQKSLLSQQKNALPMFGGIWLSGGPYIQVCITIQVARSIFILSIHKIYRPLPYYLSTCKQKSVHLFVIHVGEGNTYLRRPNELSQSEEFQVKLNIMSCM